MNRFHALVGLNMFCDIGSIRLKKLLGFFGRPENILQAGRKELVSVSGIGEKTAAKIVSLREEDIERELTAAKNSGVKILSFDDKEYPYNLKQIVDPPLILYVKGDFRDEDKFGIAIVGSRRASFYGLTNAERFAVDLSGRGFTIISGMARGIDTYAHRGALKQRNRTIAVMGSGFNYLYPPENKELAEEIAKSGAVISEFSMDTRPFPQNFPQRNRVISGLSIGVLVAEAAKNSGALITADFALEQGREVFALPGKIDSGTSFGTNALIKQGAKLVSSTEDIIEELNVRVGAPTYFKPEAGELPEIESKAQVPGLLLEESAVYSLISKEPLALDEIVERAHIDVPGACSLLFNLQIKKLIRQLPGRQFVRA